MRSVCICLIFFGTLLTSCKQVTVKYNMLPALRNSDSAVVMYYHQPGDPRFFNYTKLKDTSVYSIIAAEANGPVIEPKDNCVTEGKIYFYGKAGAVETIYFSRKEDCMTISFMKTGEKYFTKMSKETRALLDNWEKEIIVLPGRQE